ncbi:putative transcriptional regulator [Oxalobacteraceae bacterium GrIS 2.11]
MTPTAHPRLLQTTALSKTDQRRLERLAKMAGRSPQAMLRFVLRDGFAACEENVVECKAADREIATGQFVTHASVMELAHRLINDA